MSSGYSYDIESSYGAVGLISSSDENKDNSNRSTTPPSKDDGHYKASSPNDSIKVMIFFLFIFRMKIAKV